MNGRDRLRVSTSRYLILYNFTYSPDSGTAIDICASNMTQCCAIWRHRWSHAIINIWVMSTLFAREHMNWDMLHQQTPRGHKIKVFAWK